jgi:hypothetical protein
MNTQHFPGLAAGISPERALCRTVCGWSFNKWAASDKSNVFIYRVLSVKAKAIENVAWKLFCSWC